MYKLYIHNGSLYYSCMQCHWILMQAVLLCFSQFTDTRQDRPRRARGRLQGTAGARRVCIARLLSSAARGSAQRRGPVTRVPVLSAGDARVRVGLRLASGVLVYKGSCKDQ